ncbi:MAG: aldehyde dehydrogenase family protein, partial [Fimbriimonadaceae bacterium]|nr:aldehyde dehydrogenase family protein [Chitinophagales bacterium]
DENTMMGPVSSIKSADELEQQQNNSINKGAEVITGAKRIGANYQPTILANIKEGMPAYSEELFGPVASVINAKDAEDAIAIANSHRYGLAATLFTKDLDKAYYLARKINAGAVFINAMVKSDPRLPFGGVKKSGYGRELSYYGMKEFTNVKTIYINP